VRRIGACVGKPWPYGAPVPRPPSHVWRSRVALHLGTHVATRLWTVLSPMGVAQRHRLRALAAVCLAMDVAEARWLTRSEAPAAVPRTALAALDSAVWAAVEDADTSAYTAAMLPGVSLAVEAGYRGGPAAVLVPLVTWSAATAARLVVGKSAQPTELAWQALGVLGGVLLRAYERQQVRAGLDLEDRRHQATLAALAREAEADVYDRSPVADTLHSASNVLVRLLPPDAPAELADLRREQAVKAQRTGLPAVPTARYLYEVLQEACLWEVRRTADVGEWSLVEAVPQSRLHLLTAAQAQWLLAWLRDNRQRGRSTVTVPGQPLAVRAHSGLLVQVGDRSVLVPVDATTTLVLDVVPVGLALGALMTATMALENQADIPAAVCFPAAAVGLLAARRAHRALLLGDASGTSRAVVVSTLMPLMMSSVGQHTMRRTHNAGVSRFASSAIAGYWLSVGYAWRDLSPSARGTATVGSVVSIATSWVLAAHPRSVRHLLAELTWPLTNAVVASRLRVAVDAEAEEQVRLLRARHEIERASAVVEVRAAGIQALAQALERSRQRVALARSANDREDELLRVAEALVRSAEHGLQDLQGARGSQDG
jgi:hypothetical protein